jgi:hypothetical protein
MNLFGTDNLINAEEFERLAMRTGLDILLTCIVMLLIYYRVHRNRDFVFTAFVVNIITFSICALLKKSSIDTGFALGLFGIFGILRFRTQEIKMRDLAYLFVVIGIAIFNSVAGHKTGFAELMLTNGVVIIMVALLERSGVTAAEDQMPLLYDNLQMLAPERRTELLGDLSKRLGVLVTRVQVHRIDLLRDAAELTVHFSTTAPTASTAIAKKD